MRNLLLFLSVLFSSCLYSQLDYTPASYDLLGINEYRETLYVGDGEAAIIDDGIPYQLSFDSEYNYTIKYIDNVDINQDLLARYDVDRNGRKDLLTADLNKTSLFTFLNTEEGFDDISPFFGPNANSFHAQDFDGDGIDEVIINGYVYTHNQDGSRDLLMRRSPANTDYVFKSPYVMDVNEDGLQDVIVQLVTNLGYLRNNGEGRIILTLFNELNHQCRWMNVIKTVNGPKVIYYDSDNSIYKLNFDQGEISKTRLVEGQPNYGFETLATDLNQDGNEELIIYSSPANRYYILDYDAENDTVEYRSINIEGKEGALYIDDDVKPKLIGLSEGKIDVYEANADLELSHIKTSRNSTFVYHNSFVDINGDGYTDIYNSEYIRDYYGGVDFSSLKNFSIPGTGGEFQDFDGDSDADYVTEEFWYENLGDNTFSPEKPNPNYNPYPDPDIYFTTVIYEDDLDADGDIDLLTYNIFGEPLELLINTNNEYFEDPIRLADSDFISGDLLHVEALDMNGDGTKDIILGAATGVAWWPQLPDHSFGEGIHIYNGDLRPRGIDIKDANGSGFIDVVVGTGDIMAGSSDGNYSLYKGTSAGPELVGSSPIVSGYQRPTFIDYNDDDVDDILVANSNGLMLHIYNNYDELSNSIASVYADYEDYGSFLVQDVDGDSDDDIIIYDDGGTNMKYLLKSEVIENANCPLNNVRLVSKDQVKTYGERYGTCKEINGDVYIGGNTDWSDINSVADLSNIEKINGSLSIRFLNQLGNYAGLNNIDTIEGNLNMQILRPSSYDMFTGLEYVGGNIAIDNVLTQNPDIVGWDNLSYVGNDITVVRTDFKSPEPFIISNKMNGSFEWEDSYQTLESLGSLSQLDTVVGLFKIASDNIENFTYIPNLVYAGGLDISGAFIQSIELNIEQDTMPFGLRLRTNSQSGIIYQDMKLKSVGYNFSIKGADVGSWPDLEYIEKDFNLLTNNLDDISFNKLKSVSNFSATIREQIDYSNFKDLEKVRGAFSVGTGFESLNGLSSLDSIYSSFRIVFQSSITTLSGIKDDLYVGSEWTMFDNPNLNYCESPALCAHLEAGREHNIYNNAANCDEISDISCLSNSISGFTFYDHNENGTYEEDTEAKLSDIELVFDDQSSSTITDNSGFYRKYLLEGQNLKVEAIPNDEFLLTTPNFYEIDAFIPDVTGLEKFDFGFISEYEKIRYASSITSGLFICNREFEVNAKITNTSNAVGNGYFLITPSEEIIFDPEINDITSYDEETGTIKIDFSDLLPYFNKDIELTFTAPSADELFNEDINILIEVYQQENSGIVLVHEDYIPLSLLCSYDPNDKLVSSTDKSGNIRVNEVDDELIYTIRFQNTGNFYAEDVRITDQISETLDLSTFRFIDASHELEISLRERELTFMFEDIFLIDSTTSFIESQGFVSFGIKPFSYDLDTEFDNQAYIYFDFNEPIITNIAESIVYDPYVDVDETSFNNLMIFPVPAREKLYLQTKDNIEIKHYQIIDVLGQIVLDGHYENESSGINIESLSSGNYVIKVLDKNQKTWNKVFVVGE